MIIFNNLLYYWISVLSSISIALLCILIGYHIIFKWIKLKSGYSLNYSLYFLGFGFFFWAAGHVITLVPITLNLNILDLSKICYFLHYFLSLIAILLIYKGIIRIFSKKFFWRNTFPLLYFLSSIAVLFLIYYLSTDKDWFRIYLISFISFLPIELIMCFLFLNFNKYCQKLSNKKIYSFLFTSLAWLILVFINIIIIIIGIYYPDKMWLHRQEIIRFYGMLFLLWPLPFILFYFTFVNSERQIAKKFLQKRLE